MEQNVAAVDPSPMVDACRARVPGADVRTGAAEALPWPNGTFDAAFAQLVLHFLDDPRAGLVEMGRSCGPAASSRPHVELPADAAPSQLLAGRARAHPLRRRAGDSCSRRSKSSKRARPRRGARGGRGGADRRLDALTRASTSSGARSCCRSGRPVLAHSPPRRVCSGTSTTGASASPRARSTSRLRPGRCAAGSRRRGVALGRRLVRRRAGAARDPLHVRPRRRRLEMVRVVRPAPL